MACWPFISPLLPPRTTWDTLRLSTKLHERHLPLWFLRSSMQFLLRSSVTTTRARWDNVPKKHCSCWIWLCSSMLCCKYLLYMIFMPPGLL
jgi:hypothetical protein